MKSKYTPALADDICRWVSEGKPLTQWCRENDVLWRTVYNWLDEHADFQASYARARDVGHDAIAEQALQIANTPILGETEKINADGGVEITKADMLGLGLAVTKGFIESQGGSIEASNHPNGGALFTLHLPRGDVT